MSKILLVGINSQYVHTNISVRYLKKFIEANTNLKPEIYETNINNQLINIIKDIYELEPEIVVFSTYIWNKEYVFDIIKELKKILPNVKIAAGGPEVSYEWENIMKENENLDYIFTGEGEKILLNFFTKEIEEVKGVVYRKNNKIMYNGVEELITDLDIIPFPYDDSELQEYTKIFYYESSRGCPFNCSYCMSSIDKTVRYYSIERTKKDLKRFIDSPIRLLKFVDRTFNLKKERYLEIWKFLLENYRKGITFHFEINANIFDDETLDFLEQIPKGYFQFEIGVQTIDPDAMKSIGRVNILDKLEYNVKRINKNIHLHLDLIAGLPYDTYEKFKKSFNYVYNLKPEMIQLGFLKLLKGTKMYDEIDKYNYKYFSKPPYEVFSNNFMSFADIIKLKNLEQVLDFYYNSEFFEKSVEWIIKNYYKSDSFSFFEDISNYYKELVYLKINHKTISIFNYLYDFFSYKNFENKDIFVEYLKYDYLKIGKPGVYPLWLEDKKDGELYDTLIKNKNYRTVREGHKNSEFCSFNWNVLEDIEEKVYIFFDYRDNSCDIIKNVD